ncbi:MAG: ABC transporter substrate-binding protein, partial [Pseudomonadota bacterium]
MKKRTILWFGLFLLIPALCLMTFNGTAAAEKKEILIGAPLSLTGILAMDGEEQGWAYEQAAEDINKAGGI